VRRPPGSRSPRSLRFHLLSHKRPYRDKIPSRRRPEGRRLFRARRHRLRRGPLLVRRRFRQGQEHPGRSSRRSPRIPASRPPLCLRAVPGCLPCPVRRRLRRRSVLGRRRFRRWSVSGRAWSCRRWGRPGGLSRHPRWVGPGTIRRVGRDRPGTGRVGNRVRALRVAPGRPARRGRSAHRPPVRTPPVLPTLPGLVTRVGAARRSGPTVPAVVRLRAVRPSQAREVVPEPIQVEPLVPARASAQVARRT
jgi:hypothetical protein